MRGRGRGIAALGVAVVAATSIFAWAFHPQFLSFDSYHYMVLSYRPEVGNAHPLGFGWLLRALLFASRHTGASFAFVYQLWQTLCFVALVAVVQPRRSRDGASWPRRAGGVGLLAIFVALLLPALMFVMNGYWTDMTSYLAIALGALSIDRALRTGSGTAWTAFMLCCAVGFHIRLQLVVLPVCGVVATLLWTRRKPGVRMDRSRQALIAMIGALALVWGSERLLATTFPTNGMAREESGTFLQKSVECRLRCAARLYTTDCSTTSGRRLIERASCADLIANQIRLGKPLVDPYRIRATLALLGPLKIAEWLILAPATYLRESYFTLDVEDFGFDRHVRILSRQHAALEPYARALPPVGTAPAPAFRKLLAYLGWLYFKERAFHVLAGLSLVASGAVLVWGRRASAVFLATTCLLTYFVFSTMQPKAPLHYLVQIAVPGFVALAVEVLHGFAADPARA